MGDRWGERRHGRPWWVLSARGLFQWHRGSGNLLRDFGLRGDWGLPLYQPAHRPHSPESGQYPVRALRPPGQDGTCGAGRCFPYKDGPAGPRVSGKNLTYTITVTNNGPDSATGV